MAKFGVFLSLGRKLWAVLLLCTARLVVGQTRTGTSTLTSSTTTNSFNTATYQSTTTTTSSGGSATFYPVANARRRLAQSSPTVLPGSAVFNFNFTYDDSIGVDIYNLWDPTQCVSSMSFLFVDIVNAGGLVCDFKYTINFPAINTTYTYDLAVLSSGGFPPLVVNLAKNFVAERCGPQPPSSAPPPSPPPPPPPPAICSVDVVLDVASTNLYRCIQYASVVQQLFQQGPQSGIVFNRPFQCSADAPGILDAAASFPSFYNETFYENFEAVSDRSLTAAMQPFLPTGCTTATIYAGTRPPCTPAFARRVFACTS